jgi:acyl dehydratase
MLNKDQLQIGQLLTPASFIVNREILKGYADASGDQNPIHQDEDFAKSVGLPSVIAHGMLTMALGGRYLSELAGGPQSIKEFSSRFTKPVVVPAGEDVEIIFTGKISSIEGNQIRVDLEARSSGEKVLGMAKAVLEI